MSSQKHRIPYTLSAPWLNSCSSVTRAMLLSWLIGKDPDAGKDWGQEEKGVTEDQMVGWHHWLDGHGFGWILEVGDGQGGLACCSPWVPKELNMTRRLNWTELRNQRSNCQHLLDHRKSKRVPEKHLLMPYWLYQSHWLWIRANCGKFFKSWEYQTTLPASWEPVCRLRSNS